MDGTSSAAWLRLALALAACQRQVRKMLGEEAARHGISESECLLLFACYEAGSAGRVQHELAALVGVSTAQLSALVEALGQRDLVAGYRPAHDRRRQAWRVTPGGCLVLEQVARDFAARWQSAAAPVAELQRLAQLLSVPSPASPKEAA